MLQTMFTYLSCSNFYVGNFFCRPPPRSRYKRGLSFVGSLSFKQWIDHYLLWPVSERTQQQQRRYWSCQPYRFKPSFQVTNNYCMTKMFIKYNLHKIGSYMKNRNWTSRELLTKWKHWHHRPFHTKCHHTSV